jgi:anti-sigma B factor antagonist
MELKVTKHGDVVCIVPEMKRIDAAEAIAFKGRLAEIIDEGSLLLLLNLKHVEFVDSSGLGAIISTLRAVGTKGEVKLCHVGEQVMKLLNLTRLDKVLEVYPTEEDALARF